MTGAVLLVDDNAALVDNLNEVLTDAGYAVLSASTCAEARRAGERGFDVALIDMRLPDGLGIDLLASLKAEHPDTEIILLTGYSTIEAASAAVRAGAFAYLTKPCATDDLLLTVKQAKRQVQAVKENRSMNRRIQVAEKLAAVGTMTAGLTHEIRNPLNAAGLQLAVLERRIEKLPVESRPALMAPLTLARDEISRLDHLLEDFLQMARPREPRVSSVELGSLVGRVLDLLDNDAERRTIRVERDFGTGPTVEIDQDQFRQIVMNLSLNALEASKANGVVRASVRTTDDDVVLSIEDSGPGVPEALRERIFEPFFTTKASGSGLGLPIVRAIVTQHGGSIAVEEAALGGACFVIRLPHKL